MAIIPTCWCCQLLENTVCKNVSTVAGNVSIVHPLLISVFLKNVCHSHGSLNKLT